jgi:hypothetical protein
MLKLNYFFYMNSNCFFLPSFLLVQSNESRLTSSKAAKKSRLKLTGKAQKMGKRPLGDGDSWRRPVGDHFSTPTWRRPVGDAYSNSLKEISTLLNPEEAYPSAIRAQKPNFI